MPRYFFHLSAPDNYSVDDVGLELAGSEAAYLAAHQAVLEMSVDMLRDRVDPHRHAFIITDQANQVLFELPFSEVLRPAQAIPHPNTVHASIERYRDSALKTVTELKTAVDTTRRLLQTTRNLLGSAPERRRRAKKK